MVVVIDHRLTNLIDDESWEKHLQRFVAAVCIRSFVSIYVSNSMVSKVGQLNVLLCPNQAQEGLFRLNCSHG